MLNRTYISKPKLKVQHGPFKIGICYCILQQEAQLSPRAHTTLSITERRVGLSVSLSRNISLMLYE